MDRKAFVEKIVKILDDKKAENISALDVRGLTSLADYFIIATANSETHAKALSDYIEEEIKKQTGELPHHVEGREYNRWVVLDYGDVIVHIMLPEVRDYYGIDWLWADAKKVF
ncbi:MAG: ribosome silencing factor [Gammaproteobacteria bacterium]|nr:MAG: ribosome silencing factor [Gammaproteobacteria bacterium]RTZ67964.1 MAG: ribosome silencing factor [Aquificaceae bacterium]